jgi:predicted outer membrane protein
MMRPHRTGVSALTVLTAAALVIGSTAGCGRMPQGRAGAQDDPADAPVWSAQPSADSSIRQTRWGPLSAVDQDLVKKVRLASLWEMTMAQEATKRAQSPRIRQFSGEIVSQHMILDRRDRALAAQLGVTLPTAPSPTQQEWMAEIRSQRGAAYDSTYVKWLRFAHGQVFALIGTVRGSTQNTLVRPFSEICNKFVLNHQRLLESTGLTSSASFPTPPPVTK